MAQPDVRIWKTSSGPSTVTDIFGHLRLQIPEWKTGLASPLPSIITWDRARFVREYEELKKAWHETAACERLHNDFKSTVLQNDRVRIEQAVCTGLGSLTSPSRPWGNQLGVKTLTALNQLILFETIIEWLRMFDSPIPVLIVIF